MNKLLIAIGISLIIFSGCSSDKCNIEGTWEMINDKGEETKMMYEFNNGRCSFTLLKSPHKGTYKFDGKKIIMKLKHDPEKHVLEVLECGKDTLKIREGTWNYWLVRR